jgi:NAD(P)-dependent dehydrogenase (short-subunit alcohol dehydrogenase family)
MNGVRPVLLVTGGTRGIGAAITSLAAMRGYSICATYRSDDEAAQALERRLHAGGTECILLKGDVGDPAFAAYALARTIGAFGTLAAVVNNAGITGRIGRFTDTSPETLQKLLAVNLLGPMLMCRGAVSHWLARRQAGAIVNISSIAASLGAPNEYVGYAATKAGLEALTVGLAKEVAPHGIRVNAVAPGTVFTDIHAAAGEPGRPQRVVSRVPMARIGEPEEIAAAVLWLLSAEASYTTGAILRVSGGL